VGLGNIFFVCLYQAAKYKVEKINFFDARPYKDTLQHELIVQQFLGPIENEKKSTGFVMHDSLADKLILESSDFRTFHEWLNSIPSAPASDLIKFKRDVVGTLDRSAWTLWLLPRYNRIPADELANKYRLFKDTKSSTSHVGTGNRFLFISIVQGFRDELTASVTQPARLLQALGDYIQWLTFIGAVWCLILLVMLRLPWCRMQTDLVEYKDENIPWLSRINNIWNLRAQVPLKNDLNKSHKFAFIAPRLIAEVETAAEDGANVQEIVRSRVNGYRDSVEIGEYEIINYLVWLSPTLGFIGTIFGIIKAMEGASKVFQSSGGIEQGTALDTVSVSLGTAFDTSFVALIWMVPMMYYLAKTKQHEANFFEKLEYRASVELPDQINALKKSKTAPANA
jgi:biopolymer transport protein ExbB/TolQ